MFLIIKRVKTTLICKVLKQKLPFIQNYKNHKFYTKSKKDMFNN